MAKTLEMEVRSVLKNNRWMTLATADRNGVPQSSVVMYASDGKVIYVMTGKNTKKACNIRKYKQVAVTIPFYKSLLHRLITIAPPAEITFRGTAELLDQSDEEAQQLYGKKMKVDVSDDIKKDSIWIKITPGNRIECYGVGIRLYDLKNPEKARKILKL